MKFKAVIRKRDLRMINSADVPESVKTYPIQLYCYDKGKVCYISTRLTTTDEEFDGKEFKDKTISRNEQMRKTKQLADMLTAVGEFVDVHREDSFEELKGGIKEIVCGTPLNEGRIVDYVMKCWEDKGLSAGTRKVYRQLHDKLMTYDQEITFDGMDSAWLRKFEADMRRTMSTNGLAIPMRTLKSVFNWAKRKKITANYPFEDYKVKKARVPHLALKAQLIADIRDYPVEKHQERYRDCFLLMFYLCGIDSVDLAKLTWQNVKRGRLQFTRQKENSVSDLMYVDIPISPEAKEIIKRYRGEEHLLSWFDNRADYNSFTRRVNQTMKRIGYLEIVKDKVGKRRKHVWHSLLDECSTKTARRSFSTIARRIGIAEPLIGQTLGHAWANNTTQIYECFDQTDVDDAIRRVLDHVSALKGRNKAEICEEIRQRDEL